MSYERLLDPRLLQEVGDLGLSKGSKLMTWTTSHHDLGNGIQVRLIIQINEKGTCGRI
jgi:hypothetical protein